MIWFLTAVTQDYHLLSFTAQEQISTASLNKYEYTIIMYYYYYGKTLMKYNPDERPSRWEKPPRWETIPMINHPDEKPPRWETTLMSDHSDERSPWWEITLMADHPYGRPFWWEITPMHICPPQNCVFRNKNHKNPEHGITIRNTSAKVSPH